MEAAARPLPSEESTPPGNEDKFCFHSSHSTRRRMREAGRFIKPQQIVGRLTSRPRQLTYYAEDRQLQETSTKLRNGVCLCIIIKVAVVLHYLKNCVVVQIPRYVVHNVQEAWWPMGGGF